MWNSECENVHLKSRGAGVPLELRQGVLALGGGEGRVAAGRPLLHSLHNRFPFSNIEITPFNTRILLSRPSCFPFRSPFHSSIVYFLKIQESG